MAYERRKKARSGPSSASKAPSPRPSASPLEMNCLSPSHPSPSYDTIAKVLLELPSYASLARAVLTSKNCLRLACSGEFRRSFHELHPCGYPFLGHFSYHEDGGPSKFPVFHPSSFRHDPDLSRVVRSGDFLLTRLDNLRWRIHDCLYGRLLLTSSNNEDQATPNFNRNITVFNPLSQQLELVPDPPTVRRLYNLFFLPSTNCSTGIRVASGFRLAGFQRRKSEIRLVVYESSTQQWTFCPEVNLSMPPESDSRQYNPPMHACGYVYWRYRGGELLRLDCTKMELSAITLPPGVQSCWSIGETEDGEHCLVSVARYEAQDELHLWVYDDRDDGGWKMKRQERMRSKLGIRGRVTQVRAVVDGLVVLCMDGAPVHRPHLALHLTTFEVLDEFDCHGVPFPYIMPWPCRVEAHSFQHADNNAQGAVEAGRLEDNAVISSPAGKQLFTGGDESYPRHLDKLVERIAANASQMVAGSAQEIPIVGDALMLEGEGDQMLEGGGGQMLEGGGDLMCTREDAAQTQGCNARHEEIVDKCLACDGNHRLLHCDSKWSLWPPARLFGQSTTKPFYYMPPSNEARGKMSHLVGDPLSRVWFKVFQVPDIIKSWKELFETASSVGLLVDVDLATLDGNMSNYVRMLIDLKSTDGAPFFSCFVYGTVSINIRFELEEN